MRLSFALHTAIQSFSVTVPNPLIQTPSFNGLYFLRVYSLYRKRRWKCKCSVGRVVKTAWESRFSLQLERRAAGESVMGKDATWFEGADGKNREDHEDRFLVERYHMVARSMTIR